MRQAFHKRSSAPPGPSPAFSQKAASSSGGLIGQTSLSLPSFGGSLDGGLSNGNGGNGGQGGLCDPLLSEAKITSLALPVIGGRCSKKLA